MKDFLEIIYQIFIAGGVFFHILLFILTVFGVMKPRKTNQKRLKK